jgi:hypothetical protein
MGRIHAVTVRQAGILLPYLGALPFYLGFALWPYWAGAPAAVLAYGAVIAAFVSGLGWTQAMVQPERAPASLLVLSNITALAVWVALLLPPGKLGFGIEALVFAVLLGIDWRLMRKGAWPLWFWPVRRNVSALVIAALLIWMVVV